MKTLIEYLCLRILFVYGEQKLFCKSTSFSNFKIDFIGFYMLLINLSTWNLTDSTYIYTGFEDTESPVYYVASIILYFLNKNPQ